MRQLKLQMQVTADGFVAGPEGQLDWMTQPWDDQLVAYVNHLTDTSDTILLGRKMTEGFVSYWEHVTSQPENPEYPFARKMVDYPKVVFSRTVSHLPGQNVRVENRDVVAAVQDLKNQSGQDLIVYGGATFVASLIEHRLIDELNLFVNSVAIGKGLQIFTGRTPLRLTTATEYACGVVVHQYAPA
jgi:dihydrofolate reductase